VLFGVFWGGWAVAAANIEHALGLSAGGLGVLLSVSLVGGSSANFVGGSLCERFGTLNVLRISLVIWAVFLLLGAAMRSPIVVEIAIVLIVLTGGLVDVAMNVAAAASLSEKPGLLVAFHARFNAGAAAGAALTGALLALQVSWRWTWVAVAVVAVVLSIASRGETLPTEAHGERRSLLGVVALLRREHLVVLAMTFALAALVEGGIDLWGVLFLRTQLASGLLIGAGGAVLAYSVAAGARSLFGPVIGHKGAARGLVIGAGIASLGIAVLATAPIGPVGAVGLVLGAGGISMCWPLLVARSSSGRQGAGSIVGAVTACGYLGLVAGPALVGLVADSVGLRGALALLASGSLVVAFIAMTWRRSELKGTVVR
jgi:MFS family permease